MLSEKLKAARLAAGLSRRAVAKSLKVSARTVARWEAGDCAPKFQNVSLMAAIYGVSLKDLAA